MGKIVEINTGNFEQEVANAKGLVLLDFAAEWCGPCKRLAPILEELAGTLDGKVKVGHLDVDNAPDIAAQFGVMSVPTVILFKDGHKVGETVGLVPKEKLQEMIQRHQ